MDVYVEDVFIDNFLIDFVILFITSKILHLQTKWWHLCLCACFGVVLSILNLMFALSGIPLFLYKFLCGALIVLCFVPKAKPTKYLTTYATFLFLTFLIGGACLAISFTFGNATTLPNGEISYNLTLPIGVVMFIVCAISWLILNLLKSLKHKLSQAEFVFYATIILGNKKITTKAFLDTGNTICDPETKQPILFLSYKHFKKIVDIPLTEILLHKNITSLPNAHYLSVATIGNKTNKMLVFSVDTVLLKQEQKTVVVEKAMLGLTFSNLQKNLDVGLLLNPKVLSRSI